MSRIRNETKLSTYQIGYCIGRDHATVLYGVRKWREMDCE
jgi:chromosomal replication initiation ATPase DnaA